MLEINTLQLFMKKHKREIIFIFFITIPCFVVAVDIPNPVPCDDIPCLLNMVVGFIRNVALMIAPIIFIIAGLMYYFAGGNPEKAKNATNLIKYAIIGLVIILIANGITAVIKDIMGVN
jgi:hypothetical protein